VDFRVRVHHTLHSYRQGIVTIIIHTPNVTSIHQR